MGSTYEKKPWLKHHPEWVPSDLDLTHDTALSDFKNAAVRKPEAPEVYYFDHVISYGEIDRLFETLYCSSIACSAEG